MVAAKFQNDQHDQVAGVLQTVSVAEQVHKKQKSKGNKLLRLAMLAQSGSLMDVGRKAFTEQVSRPESGKESTSSKLQTVDASDQMVRFAKGEVQHY